ncbi:hypothetical protein [Rhodoferax sp.]|uniref:hypothetical protein n=1 Tax=Rhodoferax sp. TaxID=50421 RepID=UPI00374D165D
MPLSPSPPPPPLPDDLQALQLAEQIAVLARRQRVLDGVGPSNSSALHLPRVGLALSGGGVRSATFALGLMRGMAQNRSAEVDAPASLTRNGLLGRLDYLSTVSGGGYIGAMWGRLVATYGIQLAQQLMLRSDSPVLQWLRRNGRYLNPAGSRDTGIAVATYLRAWLAIHMEFMFAGILLGLVVVAPHLFQHRLQWLGAWAPWGTPWWVLALAWALATVPGLIAGNWAARDGPTGGGAVRRRPGLRELAFLLVALSLAALLCLAVARVGWLASVLRGPGWLNALALGLTSLALGQLGVTVWLSLSHQAHSLLITRIRHAMTGALRWALVAVLWLVLLGAMDWSSWRVLEWLLEPTQRDWLWGSAGAGGLLLVLLRNLVQPLQKMAAETNKQASDWLPRLANLGSQLAFVLLVLFWLVCLQWFVFAPSTFSAFTDVPALWRALLLAGAFGLWMLLTAGNAQMANASSLHGFYRGRLARAYLAVGNPARQMGSYNARVPDVTKVVQGDDMHLRNYMPETHGGPIHLVNTCLNQSRDDRSGLYNADRKGTAITASWRGFEVGPGEFIAMKRGHDTGTLGSWVAVSGAAASPGAGAYTSRGLALLVYLLGVRLGHWMQAPQQRATLRWGSRFAWRYMPKPWMLASEASATFYGMDRPWWYLSDGGHFENTGVYALLKRELDFIILSDASCDAQYEFADLENLVRKARIDFGAEIDFYSHAEAERVLTRLFTQGRTEVTVLSPEDMANNHSCRGVLLGRIRYRERPGLDGAMLRPEGTLLVVKPNLHDALDVDVLAYAQKHPTFPHESTSDQSFDEAQWESYHRLGEDFGRALSDDWLALLPGWRSPAQHGMQVAARLSGTNAGEEAKTEPLWRRGARATAIGTTLGLGASGTLLLSLWQTQDQIQRQSRDEQAETRQLFTKVSENLSALDGRCPKLPEHVLTQTLDLLDRRGTPAMRPLDAAGVDRLVEQVAGQCALPQAVDLPQTPENQDCGPRYQRMQAYLCTRINKPAIENTAMDFWLPGVSPAEQGVGGDKILQALHWQSGRWDLTAVLALLGQPPPGRVASTAPLPGGVYPSVGAAEPLPTPVPPVLSAEPSSEVARACARANGKTTLYIQVYDEASQTAAAKLRKLLQIVAGGTLQVAPIENVVRSADLRQQRRPIPWAKPTFVLHDATVPALKTRYQDCAKALAPWVAAGWALPGEAVGADAVWLRDLPNRLLPTPGVMELWLPPITAQNMAIATAAEH